MAELSFLFNGMDLNGGNRRGGGHRGGGGHRHTTFVIMISNDGRIFCVQNPQGKWMLPGGFNDGERSTVAGAREVQEETGYRVNLSKSPFVIDGKCKIFIVKGYPFPVSHNARMKIFNARTTPHETKDYGWFNPRTSKVEKWDGNHKNEQLFRRDFFRNLNFMVRNYRGEGIGAAAISGHSSHFAGGGHIVHAAPVFHPAHFAGGGHIVHAAPVVHPVHFTGGMIVGGHGPPAHFAGGGHRAIVHISGANHSGGSRKLPGPPKRSPVTGVPTPIGWGH